MRCIIFILTCVLFCYGCAQESPVDQTQRRVAIHSLSEELKIFHDIGSLPQYEDNIQAFQVSSYDTTGKNDDGFNGRYSFLRRNADSTLVIFDVKGSGVINRIWTPTPTEDTLDFFLDDAKRPTFSVRFIDLFSGSQFPFVGPLCGNQLGGYYCYMPIPFEKGCKIVSRGKLIQFHQIQYKKFGAGAKVKTFSLTLNEEEKQELEKITSRWSKEPKTVDDFYSANFLFSSKTIELKPGSTAILFEVNKGGRIGGIEIDPMAAFEGLQKNVDIKITWDDDKQPAVFCPLADFFGYAFGKASMHSLLLGTKGNVNYCYFPMPFDSKAKIELVNRFDQNTSVPLSVNVKVWYTENPRVPELEGKFYAYWNKHTKSEKGKPHIFLDVQGKGHYVATILQAQGMKAGMTYFFEGDDSTVVDGRLVMHGTGSEDYFNGGWYALMDRWEGKMSLPLHGALDYSLPFCRTGGYRLFLSDKIPFTKSFHHSIEHGPVGNAFPVDYTSVGFYYADSPPNKITAPTDELAHVFVPDTLVVYPQLMRYNLFGSIDIKTTWKYGTGGESYLFTPGGKESGVRISLSEIPVGAYEMYFDVMKEPDGCDFSVWQRQTPVSKTISTYNSNEERASNVYVADIEVGEFKNTITMKFNTNAHQRSLLLNRIIFIRKK